MCCKGFSSPRLVIYRRISRQSGQRNACGSLQSCLTHSLALIAQLFVLTVGKRCAGCKAGCPQDSPDGKRTFFPRIGVAVGAVTKISPTDRPIIIATMAAAPSIDDASVKPFHQNIITVLREGEGGHGQGNRHSKQQGKLNDER